MSLLLCSPTALNQISGLTRSKPLRIFYVCSMSHFFLRSESEVNFSSESLSSHVLLFNPIIIFTARRWTFSDTSISWINHGYQAAIANSRWHFTNCLYRFVSKLQTPYLQLRIRKALPKLVKI